MGSRIEGQPFKEGKFIFWGGLGFSTKVLGLTPGMEM